MPRRGAAERRGWGPLGCGWVEPPSGIGSSAPCRGGRGGAAQQAAVGLSSSEALSAQEESTKAYDAYDREEKNAIVASPPTRGFPVAAPCAPPLPPPPPLLPPGAAWPPSPTPPPLPSHASCMGASCVTDGRATAADDGRRGSTHRRAPARRPRHPASTTAAAAAAAAVVAGAGTPSGGGPLTLAPSAGPSCRPLASLL